MTVAELIEKLRALPQDLPVYTNDYEFGISPEIVVEQQTVDCFGTMAEVEPHQAVVIS